MILEKEKREKREWRTTYVYHVIDNKKILI